MENGTFYFILFYLFIFFTLDNMYVFVRTYREVRKPRFISAAGQSSSVDCWNITHACPGESRNFRLWKTKSKSFTFCLCHSLPTSYSSIFKFSLLIYFLSVLAVLDLCRFAQAFSSCGACGLLFAVVWGPHCSGFSGYWAQDLGARASAVAALRLRCWGAGAQ